MGRWVVRIGVKVAAHRRIVNLYYRRGRSTSLAAKAALFFYSMIKFHTWQYIIYIRHSCIRFRVSNSFQIKHRTPEPKSSFSDDQITVGLLPNRSGVSSEALTCPPMIYDDNCFVTFWSDLLSFALNFWIQSILFKFTCFYSNSCRLLSNICMSLLQAVKNLRTDFMTNSRFHGSRNSNTYNNYVVVVVFSVLRFESRKICLMKKYDLISKEFVRFIAAKWIKKNRKIKTIHW